jgi:hypothetical protein
MDGRPTNPDYRGGTDRGLVKTLGETDTTVPTRFRGHLEQAYNRVKGYKKSSVGILEALEWSADVATRL